jgi:arylsulfatase A-like enzyme
MYPIRADFDPVKPSKAMDLSEGKKAGPVDPDEIIPLYKGEITFLDVQIGRLLALLGNLGIARNTLIVLAADHGESMTEKGIYFCHGGLYNTVTHVPLIMSLPGEVPEGLEVKTLTSLIDIFPTALEILGYECETEHINGRSLLPAFLDPQHRTHEFIITEAVNGVIGGIYREGFKYMKPYYNDWAVKEDHLFRPFEDYREEEELKEEEKEIAQRMEVFLDNWLGTAKEFSLPSIRRKNLDKEMKEALKSLGYIK